MLRRFDSRCVSCVVLALICLTCVRTASSRQAHDDRSVALIQNLVIGTEVAGDEYLFGAITNVAVDERGTMYVADRKRADIRVFDSTGTYVGALGRPGQGPGELNEVYGMGFDCAGRLVVADRGNARFTSFETRKRFGQFESVPSPGDFMISPKSLLCIGGELVVLYPEIASRDEVTGVSRYRSEFLHSHRSGLAFASESFGRLAELYEVDERFPRIYSTGAGAYLLTSSEAGGGGRLVVTPHIPSGKLAVYTKADGGWSERIVESPGAVGPAYREVDRHEFSDMVESQQEKSSSGRGYVGRPLMVLTHAGEGTVYAELRRMSLGSVPRADGSILHLYLEFSRTNVSLRAELYEATGSFLWNVPVETDLSPSQLQTMQIKSIADGGVLYVALSDEKGHPSSLTAHPINVSVVPLRLDGHSAFGYARNEIRLVEHELGD